MQSDRSLAAIDRISLQLDDLIAEGWQAVNPTLEWLLFAKSNNLLLSFDRLTLPSLDLSLMNGRLRCSLSETASKHLICREGVADFSNSLITAEKVPFSLEFFDNGFHLIASKLKFAQGAVALDVRMDHGFWVMKLNGQHFNLAVLQNLSMMQGLALPRTALINLDGVFKGEQDQLQTASFNYSIERLTGDYSEGSLAFEDLASDGSARIKQDKKGQWNISFDIGLKAGAAYFEPILLSFNEEKLRVQADVKYSRGNSSIFVRHALVTQDNIFQLMANGEWDNKLSLEAKLEVKDYSKFYPLYVNPFLYGSAMQDLDVKGKSTASVRIDDDKIISVASQFDAITMIDSAGRFSLQELNAELNWDEEQVAKPSFLDWKQASFYKIPFDKARIPLQLTQSALTFLHPVNIGVLAGDLQIDKFSADWHDAKSPVFDFEGKLNDLSLGKMAEALEWKPISGEISGTIPQVSYQNSNLKVDGALEIQVFDGSFRIDKLQATHILDVLPRLQSNISFSNLDLAKLTRHFSMGHIEGQLEGHLNELVLEDWKPVAFNAWLGSPEKDALPHIISQKAVENLTSLGGGSATEALSRGFIGFFDEFNYDKIGVGCRLSRGVCQLSGVGAADNGYYIVKGRGIPRINVIGYNRQVDWPVLLKRLQRITHSEGAVVQ